MTNDLIDKNDWKNMAQEEREWLTFNFLQNLDTRVEKLENRKWLHAGLQMVGGVVGGFSALFLFIRFFKIP